MKIEKIIYQTARSLNNVEDKLSISVLFLFCYKESVSLFSELLYTSDHEEFIEKLNSKYSDYEVDFSVNLGNKNVSDSLLKTIEKVIEIYDRDGFYKALFEKDPFALAIEEIVDNFKNLKQ